MTWLLSKVPHPVAKPRRCSSRSCPEHDPAVCSTHSRTERQHAQGNY